MPDLKYGRLFTEADVRQMLIEAACSSMNPHESASAGGIAEVVLAAYPATFPVDEPLFLLRGQDVAAPDAIEEYGVRALEAGHADGDDKRERLIPHLDRVDAAEGAFRIWQRDNPDRVKRPS